MIAYAFIWYLGNWGGLEVAVLPMLGVSGGQWGAPPILAHIALSYPSGRLQAAFDRVVLGVAYSFAICRCVVILLVY